MILKNSMGKKVKNKGGLSALVRGPEARNSISTLKEIIKNNGLTEPDVIIPDTTFIMYLDKVGNKKSAIDLSGYKIILLPKVIEESESKMQGKAVKNYLRSDHINVELIQDIEIPEAHKKIMRDTWGFCVDCWNGGINKYTYLIGSKSENKYRKYGEVENNILIGADAEILSYTLSNPEDKILILTGDQHIKALSKLFSSEPLSKLFDLKHNTHVETFNIDIYGREWRS